MLIFLFSIACSDISSIGYLFIYPSPKGAQLLSATGIENLKGKEGACVLDSPKKMLGHW
jgi:hypothetical protein